MGVDFTFGGLTAPGGEGGPVYGVAYMFIFEFIIKIPNQRAPHLPTRTGWNRSTTAWIKILVTVQGLLIELPIYKFKYIQVQNYDMP